MAKTNLATASSKWGSFWATSHTSNVECSVTLFDRRFAAYMAEANHAFLESLNREVRQHGR